MTEPFLQLYGEATKTAFGFFWKAGWAFVLGYFISSMIQAFVPKGRLTPYMGDPDFKSLSLASMFGAISSSCSFAALATARSLLLKGAHFIATVAFMFASTNLVIELGILILIFLGWRIFTSPMYTFEMAKQAPGDSPKSFWTWNRKRSVPGRKKARSCAASARICSLPLFTITAMLRWRRGFAT